MDCRFVIRTSRHYLRCQWKRKGWIDSDGLAGNWKYSRESHFNKCLSIVKCQNRNWIEICASSAPNRMKRYGRKVRWRGGERKKPKDRNVNYRKEFACPHSTANAVNDSRRDENKNKINEKYAKRCRGWRSSFVCFFLFISSSIPSVIPVAVKRKYIFGCWQQQRLHVVTDTFLITPLCLFAQPNYHFHWVFRLIWLVRCSCVCM